MGMVSNIIDNSTALAQQNVQLQAGVKTMKMAMDSKSSVMSQLIDSNTELMKQLGVGNNFDSSV